MKHWLVLILTISNLFLFSTTIELKNEKTVEGDLVGKQWTRLYLRNSDGLWEIDNSFLTKVTDDEGDNITLAVFEDRDWLKRGEKVSESKNVDPNNQPNSLTYKFRHNKIETNWAHLTSTFAFGYLAYDRFTKASEIKKDIKDIEELEENDDTGITEEIYKDKKKRLKKEKSRSTYLGIACSIGSVINFTYSFEKVDVQANLNSVSLTYNF